MTAADSALRLADTMARLSLLTLSGMGPARIRWLLSRHDPIEVVARIRSGEPPASLAEAPPGITASDVVKWRSEIAAVDPERLLEEQLQQGWTIVRPDDPIWPFAHEAEPPLLLFCAGNVGLIDATPAVAVVGTRRCTSVGRTVAHQMGFDLAASGIAVVSGLALGIDAAAHKGALDGGGAPIGVVGTGLDVVYPLRNRSLWDEVIATGVLVSEYPARTGPARWRFPARNRLIASLSDAAVIVESHGAGGSLLTADEATDRDKPVLAVPGSVLSPAADGTNGLIVDGAIPARDATDVLMALGWSPPSARRPLPSDEPAEGEPLTLFDTDDRSVVGVIRREVQACSISLDALSSLTGAPPMEVLAAVRVLVEAGEVDVEGSTVIGRH